MKTTFGLGRNLRQVWENLYMIMAGIVILASVLALLLSAKYPAFFSVCFFAAALMQICHGCAVLCPDDKHRRAYGWAMVLFVMALVLLILGIISLGIR